MYGTSVFRLARTSSVRYYKNDSTKKLLEFLAGMPKANTKRIAEAQQQRQTISKKGEKYGPSTVYLQVLGSGARGVPNTLYLFTDQKRYLFNCGECTQRLAHEHKVKLSRLEHIFITTKTWKNIGGLPGLSLTLQDVGVPKITLHGPAGLDELYNATKRFVIMKEMQVTMAPSNPVDDFRDSVMNVKYVLLTPQVSLLQEVPPKPLPCKRARIGEVPSTVYDQFTHDDIDYYKRGNFDADVKKMKPRRPRSPGPEQRDKKKTEKALNDLKTQKHSIAYVCTLRNRLGTLDLAKCVEKGVPPGPLLGQLKSGLDVVLSDGTIVLSSEVKTPDDPGPVFIVLELPDISYLSESEFSAHFDNGTNPEESIPALIVHMSPPEVFHHPAYKSFMAKFGQSTRHLILNSQNSCLGSEAVHRTQHKLHLLDPEVFPLLKDPSLPAVWSTHPPIPKSNSPIKMKEFEDLKNRIAVAQFQNIINTESVEGDAPTDDNASKMETYSSRTLTMFHLRPKKQIDRSAEPKLHIQDYYQETMDVDGFDDSLVKFRALVHDVRYAKNASMPEYPKIVFLGTGSCIPSKTRNTSGIIVHVNDQSTILLDCGEGTFGQLVRFYGPRRVDELLRTLKAIYISHLHADHHIGLIGVLQARAAAFSEAPDKNVPVVLMAPGQIVTWLTMYDQQFERICGELSLIPNQNLMENAKDSGLTPAMLERIGLESVQTCLVPHCPNSFGVAITAAGHKITYSGDTLPTNNLVKIGENSTILIHEATMEDELEEEARIKMHSTTSQAIEIGRSMNAKYTLLTHFSQRYARLPRLNAHILNDNNTVGIAFDNMQVTLSDLPLLPHMYAPLQLMFADHCVDMELKAATRSRKRERRNSLPGDLRSRGSTRRCSTSRCGSISSSTTRSLTRKESDSSREGRAKRVSNVRDLLSGGKSATILKRMPRAGLRGGNSTKRDDTPSRKAGHLEPLRTASVLRYKDTIAPRGETPSGEARHQEPLQTPSILRYRDNISSRDDSPSRKAGHLEPIRTASVLRYKDTIASRLRREALGTSSSHVAQRRGTSPSPNPKTIRKSATPTTLLNCKISRPRSQSPTPDYKSSPRPYNNQIPLLKCKMSRPRSPSPTPNHKASPSSFSDQILTTVGQAELTKNAQEFCSAVSSPPSSLNTSCKLARGKTISHDIKGSEGKPHDTRKNQSKDPRISKTNTANDVCMGSGSTTKSSTKQQSEVSVSRGRSFVRLSSGVGGVRSPVRCDREKEFSVITKTYSIPAPTQRFSSVKAAKPLSAPSSFNRRQSKPLPLIESDLKTSSNPTQPRPPKMIFSCNSRASANSNGIFSPTKSFKPQLEDIKSSFMLLNENHEEQNKITDEVPKKPPPVNENMRKAMLLNSMMKFQSKQYRYLSKFDKIEGLNWISWK